MRHVSSFSTVSRKRLARQTPWNPRMEMKLARSHYPCEPSSLRSEPQRGQRAKVDTSRELARAFGILGGM